MVLRAGRCRMRRWLFSLRRGLRAYPRRLLIRPEIGPGSRHRPMLIPEHPRPQLSHPREGLTSLMPVTQLLSHHPDVMRDLQHQRIRVTQTPKPRRVRLLKHPPRSHRIIRPLQDGPQLIRRPQNIRIVLRKVDSPEFHGMLEHSTRPSQITRRGQGLSPLPGRKERRGLRHEGHAARSARSTPARPHPPAPMPRNAHHPTLPAPPPSPRVKFSPVRPAGAPMPVAKPASGLGRLHKQVRVAEWQTR